MQGITFNWLALTVENPNNFSCEVNKEAVIAHKFFAFSLALFLLDFPLRDIV